MGTPTRWLRARAIRVGSDWKWCEPRRIRKEAIFSVCDLLSTRGRRPFSSLCCCWSPSLTPIVVSSMPYEKELAAAKKAATLAARLCQASPFYPSLKIPLFFLIYATPQISFSQNPSFTIIIYKLWYLWILILPLVWLVQKIQKALLQSDVHSKSDKSPVTVADYG